MSEYNKEILKKGNAAIDKRNYEGFLVHCTDDTEWVFVGDRTLRGKEAVRQYMAETYLEPPVNMIEALIAETDYVIATGTIKMKNRDSQWETSSYCDIWKFKDGKMAKLTAFVIRSDNHEP